MTYMTYMTRQGKNVVHGDVSHVGHVYTEFKSLYPFCLKNRQLFIVTL